MFLLEPVKNFYSRFEKPISSLFLVFGFIFDAFTLKRVDALIENLFIFGYLLIIGIFIILINVKENKIGAKSNADKTHFWYLNILQFAFGGVFSAYLILYFRSADLMVAWPFIALLAIIFIANEFLKEHYIRLSFQIGLFFLSIYWFTIFLVPVVLHKMGMWIFLLSGLISLGLIFLFILVLFHFTKFAESGKLAVFLISGIFILVNFLYFTNLIPPIPLSLKDGGIYHSIQKNKEGNYEVTYEDYGWKSYFELYPDFKHKAGKPVYAFSAIFSPKNMNTTILHEWQHYDEKNSAWKTDRIINLPVIGGRDGGFRTYSMRTNVTPGKWRVNVKTQSGQIIGRLRFKIISAETERPLEIMVK